MTALFETLRGLAAAGTPVVLLTVARAAGSTPREAGAKMLVWIDGSHGTIGGGQLEFRAIAKARDLIAAGARVPALESVPLGTVLGQCCGGRASLLFEPIAEAAWLAPIASAFEAHSPAVVVTDTASGAKLVVTESDVAGTLGDARGATEAARRLLSERGGAVLRDDPEGTPLFLDPVRPADLRIVLFGAGHVGREIVRVFAGVECAVTWVDSRDNAFPAEVPANVGLEPTGAPELLADAAPAGSYFLVMTHSHPLDLRFCEHVLRRDDFAYLGLIGSKTKRRRFEKQLRNRGVSERRLARLTCPIGVPGITGKRPADIAIAVAAQVLGLRDEAIAADETHAAQGAA